MKGVSGDPPRLRDLTPERDPVSVGALLRAAEPLPQQSAAAGRLIKRRIRKTIRERWRAPLRLRPVLIAAAVFISGGVLGATLHRLVLTPPPESAPVIERRSRSRPSTPRVPGAAVAVAPVPAAEVVEPVPAPVVAPVPVVAVAPVAAGPRAHPTSASRAAPLPSDGRLATRMSSPPPRPAEVRAPIAPPSPTPSGPSPGPSVGSSNGPGNGSQSGPGPAAAPSAEPVPHAENVLLGRAVRSLRVQRAGAAALAALDEHRARFPDSALAPEAASLRTEALLLLGRRQDAVRELDGLLRAPLPKNDERRVLRGELRGALGRWRAAIEDFDIVLGDGVRDDLAQRALWGRAVGHSRLGHEDAARADLADYLRRFPSGRFAAGAARLLGRRP